MKDIKGYEGRYAVTEDGNVWSYPKFGQAGHKGKFLAPGINPSGYKIVVLVHKKSKTTSKTVHRLVAKAFIHNPFDLPQVNHKNGIKTDNRVENLEWCTGSMNQIHAFKLGLRQRKVTLEQRIEIKKLLKGGKTQTELAGIYGITQGHISVISNNLQ